jgi:hypothetical protein
LDRGPYAQLWTVVHCGEPDEWKTPVIS